MMLNKWHNRLKIQNLPTPGIVFYPVLFFIFFYLISCSEDPPTAPTNTAPTANFTVTPDSGYIITIFNFDPSGSSDSEDPLSSLLARWDWENDGIWDTEYAAVQTLTHKYATLGTKTVKLEIQDTDGLTDSTTRKLLVTTIQTSTMTDIDGNIYQTVKIGSQWWMAENLKVTHYRNGDYIPRLTNNTQWTNYTIGAYCTYNNNTVLADTYGHLYNWYAATDSRNLAPEGWHIPTEAEWQTLVDYLGGAAVAGGKLKEQGTIHWNSPNTGATNESGFSALPGGLRYDADGLFYYIGQAAYFLSSTAYDDINVWYCGLSSNWRNASVEHLGKKQGYSVRCVQD